MPLDHYTRVDFHRFKAFRSFSLELRGFNILVGPNNAGKSTILAAFRILAHAMRRADAKKAVHLRGPNGFSSGHKVDLSAISVAEENLFFNYDDDEAAWVRFSLASGNSLTLYFPEPEVCHFIPDAQGRTCLTPSAFKQAFNCPIGFVPILGPVDHNEELYEREAARRALFNYRAARNFRNIWHHFPEKFDGFRDLIVKTWPGMDVSKPEVDRTHERPRLHMWCPEKRRPREIFWAGFGFQVWCQMLTHVLQAKSVSIFLIDEPDIYLHSELQRQLLGILRDLGPDILIATHSTEIVTEAEVEDVVLIDKARTRSRRLKNPGQLDAVFRVLGSGMNPILTQLAKTRRVLFVEGADFSQIGRFARKLGYERVGNRSDFAVVRVDGFSPERIRNLKAGMEETLGATIYAAAILDRDYRSLKERSSIIEDCELFCNMVIIHESKELENFLLVPEAIDRAASVRLADRTRRGHQAAVAVPVAASVLDLFAEDRKNYVASQTIASSKRFERDRGNNTFEETLIEREMAAFDAVWRDKSERLRVIPGKEAFSAVNLALQNQLGVSVTPAGVIEAMRVTEVPAKMVELVEKLVSFSQQTAAAD